MKQLLKGSLREQQTSATTWPPENWLQRFLQHLIVWSMSKNKRYAIYMFGQGRLSVIHLQLEKEKKRRKPAKLKWR